MHQLEIEARSTVMQAVKEGDVATAWKVLERIDRRLAPPRQLHGIEHRGEILTAARRMSDEELRERSAKLANRIGTRMSDNGGRPSTNGDS